MGTRRQDRPSTIESNDCIGQGQDFASARKVRSGSTQPAREASNHSPGTRFLTPSQQNRKPATRGRFNRDQPPETHEMPTREVLPKIKQLAVSRDDPHARRERSGMERMPVDHFETGVELDRPARASGRLAKRNLFIIKKEIVVHAA